MNRPFFRNWSFLTVLFCATSAVVLTLLADNTPNDKISEFQTAYKKASDAKNKRDLVIKAIDDGLLRRDLSLAQTKTMFGTNLQVFRRDSTNSPLRAVVFFEPAKAPLNPMMSALQTGWYIDLIFFSDDMLDYYYLSNLHK